MPVTFAIDHERRFVHARAEGVVEVKDVAAFLDAVIVENALPYRKLFDGRGSIGRYDATDVALLAARVNTYRHIDRRGALALLISRGLLHGNEWATLGVFALGQTVFVAALNGGLGHLALGMRVTRLDGTAAGPARALGRAVLLSLAVPALIWDRDQRGLHDRFMDTVLRRV